MTRVHQAPVPVSYETFVGKAQTAASDGKLSTAERRELGGAFKGLSRNDQLAALDFLREESPVLARFAQNNAPVKTAANHRVGGDQTLDGFNAMVDGMRGPGKGGAKQGPEGFSATEQGRITQEFRKLSKDDQRLAVEDLRADSPKLADKLAKELNRPQTGNAVGSGRVDDVLGMVEELSGPGKNGKKQGKEGFTLAETGKIKDAYRAMNPDDQQLVLDAIKNRFPHLAVALDRVLNPRAPAPATVQPTA